MLLNQETYYRKYGVRLVFQLPNPHAVDINWIQLPQDAIYHYFGQDSSEIGPGNDDVLLKGYKHQIPVMHVQELRLFEGNVKHLPSNTAQVIRDYHHKHHKTKLIRSIAMALSDHNTAIVYNYCLINRLYRYQQSIYSAYYKWKNMFTTVVETMAEVANECNRNQYVVLNSPRIIPGISQLANAGRGLNQNLIKVFSDHNALVLLELWKFLGEERKESIFSKVTPEKYHLINFIFEDAGKWFVLNLGRLNSWRIPLLDEQADYDKCVYQSKNMMDYKQLRKYMLRMYMTLMEYRTITAKSGILEEQKKIDSEIDQSQVTTERDLESDLELGEDEDEITRPIQTERTVDDGKEKNTIEEADLNLINLDVLHSADDLDHDEFNEHIRLIGEQIDEDLKLLDDIAEKQVLEINTSKSEINEILAKPAEVELDKPVVDLCDKLAADGAISAAEHARFTRLSASYKTIVSPDGVTTLDHYVKIQPQTLKIDKPKKMVDNPTIIDKSMVHSSLNEFDSRYIKEVLSKDVASMTLAVQNAGVALTNYRVNPSEDILGAYEEHVMKITPVIGVPSTLRFKIPKVIEDGTFESNNVKYFLRKQRGDLPIRKTGPNKVALTSYYGKCFVTRGRVNSNSYGYWLSAQVMARALDHSDESITEAVTDDVFSPYLKAPINYSALSNSFKSFKAQGFDFNFDHADVIKTYPPAIVAQVEKDDRLLIAKNVNNYLYLDKFGHVFDTMKTLPQDQPILLEAFLGISTHTAPVEYVSIGVFGKNIPLGVVLGLHMGLQKLISTLGAQYRVVPAGQRIGLRDNEYALSFADESWVFVRTDRLASLILSGFNEYSKALKNFSVYSFDKRGVYQNLLDYSGLSVRYIREIDLMFQMFIDPITLEILKDMNEPTTFLGILLRATQLLQIDQHPDELDPAYMRIKGYERVAGAVYTELVQSIRQHNGKLGKTTAQIEMNPYAIWKRITEDPAKAQSQEINPIKQLKEAEAFTFAGTGGRNKRSMTKDTREYHRNDMGTASESTVDSSDVAINVHLSANPLFTSLRGTSRRYDFDKDGAASLLSTSALLSPCSDTDD